MSEARTARQNLSLRGTRFGSHPLGAPLAKKVVDPSKLWPFVLGSLALIGGLGMALIGSGTNDSGLTVGGLSIFLAVPCIGILYRIGLMGRSVIALALPPFLLYQLSSNILANTESSGLQLALVFGAATSFALGAFLAGGSLKYRELYETSELKVNGLFLLTCVAAGATVAIALYREYGIAVLSDNIAQDRLMAFENGYLGTIVVTCLSATLIVTLLRAMEEPNLKRRIVWFFLTAVLFLLLYGFGNRGLYFIPLLVVIAFSILRRPQRAWIAATSGLLLVALIAMFGFVRDLQLYGQAHIQTLERAGIQAEWVWLGSIISYLRGTSEAVHLVVNTFPADVPHPAGETFFSALLSPLPGEQVPAGVYLKNVLGLDFIGTGLASGAIGGFYQDFGAVGVLAGFLVMGVIGRLLELQSWRSPRHLIIYAYFVAHIWFINYAHPLPFLTTITIPALLLLLVRESKTSTAQTDPQMVTPRART